MARSHRLDIYNENSLPSKYHEVSHARIRVQTRPSKPICRSHLTKQLHTRSASTTPFLETASLMIAHRSSPRPHPISNGNGPWRVPAQRIRQKMTTHHLHRLSARNLAQIGICKAHGRRWRGQTLKCSHFLWTLREDRRDCSNMVHEYA
jgi:hypothetical protein